MGHMVYFGNRKSSVYVRFYDKAIPHKAHKLGTKHD